MKNTIKSILILLPFVAAGCQDELEQYTLESPEDTMQLKVSSEEIQLSQDSGNEEAVSFTWGNAANRGEGTKLTYYFKMDIADNNFSTSIAKVEIPEGVQRIDYTHKEMNALLNNWGIPAGDEALLEAEIIAEVSGGSVYMKPEISKVQFSVTGYYTEPVDLYLVGSAPGVPNAVDALKMTEVLSGEKYEWSGHMERGTFKFINSRNSLFPSYSQGTDAGTLVYNEAETTDETLFSITAAGYYLISLDMNTMSVVCSSLTDNGDYDNVWAIGSATPANWTVENAVQLTKKDAFTFVYEGVLYEGELKFMLQNDKGYECDYLMAETNGASISSTKMVRKNYPNTNDDNDTKWGVTLNEAGTYTITLDTYRMTISFEKQDVGVEVPEDVPYKRIWILGQPDGNWTLGRAQELTYSASVKGEFVWEGNLSEGTFKFPVNDLAPGYGNLDYLMPATVTDKKASLSETGMQFIQKADDDHDYQWQVSSSEAGKYRITLNVLTMTIRFEKLEN